jgi:ADP-heptose:LPS heptosyltransferase
VATFGKDTPQPHKILVLMPRQLGDVLLTLPIAEALKRRWPEVQIHWYAHPMGKLVLENQPAVDFPRYYPVAKSKDWLGFLRNLIQEVRFVWGLRQEKFDIAVDVMNNPRTALTAFLTSATMRVSFSTRFLRNLAFHKLASRSDLSKGYVAQSRLKILETLGFELTEEWPCGSRLIPFAPEKVRVDGFLQERNVAKFIVVAAQHRHPVRKWPLEKYLELCERFWCEESYAVIWLWGPGEEKEIEDFQTLFVAKVRDSKASHIPPLLNLRETAYLCSRAQVFVGNSNGLSHVAVAGDVPTLQIHGPTTAANWTHPDSHKHRGIQRKEGCTQCNKNQCALPRRECLEELSVESVWQEWMILKKFSAE